MRDISFTWILILWSILLGMILWFAFIIWLQLQWIIDNPESNLNQTVEASEQAHLSLK
jgi:hypothetical protein